MNETLTKLQTITVGAGGVSSVTFSNIPQNYTDLIVKYSARVTASSVAPDGLGIQFNGDTGSNYKYLQLGGNGSSTFSNSGTTAFQFGGQLTGASATGNTFSNGEIYIPNYTSSNYKSTSADSVTENNATTANQNLVANLWQSTSAITSIKLYDLGSTNFVQYSEFTLYGVKAFRTAVGNSIKATGGTITFDGTYIYHTFTSTGAFQPTTSLLADVLVVAGGGGGGDGSAGNNGGGGAGGVVVLPFQNLLPGTSYVATVGSGGAKNTNGVNSVFGALTTAIGGGYGGIASSSSLAANAGASGGSGGGGAIYNPTYTGVGGSSTQTGGYGNAGGTSYNSPSFVGGGGGGAGAVGGNGTSSVSGAGGNGLNTWSQWLSATSLGVNGYIAGGGGGSGSDGWPAASGGLGGGGIGASYYSTQYATAGLTNSGSGGGGGEYRLSSYVGQPGGSGLIIVRYKA